MTVYVYGWGNNPRRAELKGRRCVVEAVGTKNTVLLRFLDTGEMVTSSRRALRPVRLTPQQLDAAVECRRVPYWTAEGRAAAARLRALLPDQVRLDV